MLRDFGFNSVSHFNRAVQLLSPTLLDYVNRSTPRTKLGGKVYTATEYPLPLPENSSGVVRTGAPGVGNVGPAIGSGRGRSR